MERNSLSPPIVHSAATPGPERDQVPLVVCSTCWNEKFAPLSGPKYSASSQRWWGCSFGAGAAAAASDKAGTNSAAKNCFGLMISSGCDGADRRPIRAAADVTPETVQGVQADVAVEAILVIALR